VHGVLDEVADRGHELGLAAADGEAAVTAAHDLDPAHRGGGTGAVHRLGDHLVHLHEVLLRQRLGPLQPGQVDELLHEPGQPPRLVLQPTREAPDRRGVLAGVEHRLGEQRHRPHRRLQLVAHVRDEVAAHRVHPAGLRDVLDEQRHVVAAAIDGGHPDSHRLRQADQPGVLRLDLDLLRLAGAAHVVHQPAQLGHEQPLATHDAEVDRRPVGQDDPVVAVHHGDGRGQRVDHLSTGRGARSGLVQHPRRGGRRAAQRQGQQGADDQAQEEPDQHPGDGHTANCRRRRSPCARACGGVHPPYREGSRAGALSPPPRSTLRSCATPTTKSSTPSPPRWWR
jgi:hypothetical protein